ncbi:hypothetical protein MWN34_17635 [Ancylobacter sp. 6x-1]|uniref:Histidine kinase n=1 Tax=Ancylobacter crimeensis TaxID=2579147 RepID=A0ABT0DFI9_9HYPH|nr:hypothetical protein [Ancylobacter crimeensis]MCK0198723.1 hypothetical protein [Ancylobacter crimeensis]
MSDAAKAQTELGDESFMSATDLRGYMDKIAAVRAHEAVDTMDAAQKARKELEKQLATPIALTPEKVHEITRNLLAKLKMAAERGDTEIMVMRFPVSLCTDHGRAINNTQAHWPETLTGRPRQAFELWQERLKPAGYRLSAMIVEWPNGMPGDVGMFLSWGN